MKKLSNRVKQGSTRKVNENFDTQLELAVELLVSMDMGFNLAFAKKTLEASGAFDTDETQYGMAIHIETLGPNLMRSMMKMAFRAIEKGRMRLIVTPHMDLSGPTPQYTGKRNGGRGMYTLHICKGCNMEDVLELFGASNSYSSKSSLEALNTMESSYECTLVHISPHSLGIMVNPGNTSTLDTLTACVLAAGVTGTHASTILEKQRQMLEGRMVVFA